MRALAVALTSFLVLGTSISGGGNRSSTSPIITSPTGIRGAWRSSADPTGFLYISEANRSIAVRAGGHPAGRVGMRFEAVGYPEGQEYVCLTSTPSASGSPTRLGMLRFRRTGSGTIKAVFSNFSGARLRTETWVLRTPDTEPNYDWDALPELITKAPLVYPESARKKGIEGTVLMEALIGIDGHVKDTRVKKSIPELDDAAAATVRHYLFRPAIGRNGKFVEVWVPVPLRFSAH